MALVLAGILAAACNRSSPDAEPVLPPEPPTTTTTIDVSKVPPTIDVPYVQAVMDSLDKVTGDMVRVLVANKLPNAEFFALLQAIYDEPEFSRAQSEFGNYAARGLAPLSPTPGNPTSKVRRIVDSSSNCVVAEIDHDYGPIFREPSTDPDAGFIQLRPKKPQRDAANSNPTPWAIVADIDAKEAQIPENPCK
ncbi:MAG: hypothetical protein M3404_13535 [Actinomycetota bacterium]|nr:hypothetical protein [Actinomycetota bacterium]